MKPITIDETLVHHLVATQFPQWKDIPVWPVAAGGWDNRTFHLGKHMLMRMPSAADYALQVEKEQRWLPKLAPLRLNGISRLYGCMETSARVTYW